MQDLIDMFSSLVMQRNDDDCDDFWLLEVVDSAKILVKGKYGSTFFSREKYDILIRRKGLVDPLDINAFRLKVGNGFNTYVQVSQKLPSGQVLHNSWQMLHRILLQ